MNWKINMFPITIKTNKIGSNGRNWPLVVAIRKDLDYPAAVWAQEAYESRFKSNPINFLKSFSYSTQREMEIMGHEIEVCVAWVFYHQDIYDYRNKEARALKGNYKIFNDYSQDQILQMLAKKHEEALLWVFKNYKDIKNYK